MDTPTPPTIRTLRCILNRGHKMVREEKDNYGNVKLVALTFCIFCGAERFPGQMLKDEFENVDFTKKAEVWPDEVTKNYLNSPTVSTEDRNL